MRWVLNNTTAFWKPKEADWIMYTLFQLKTMASKTLNNYIEISERIPISMALNFLAASILPKSCASPLSQFPKHKHLLKFHSSSLRTFAQPEGTEGRVREEDPPVSFSGMPLHKLFYQLFLNYWTSLLYFYFTTVIIYVCMNYDYEDTKFTVSSVESFWILILLVKETS